jgi:hypothetical protein
MNETTSMAAPSLGWRPIVARAFLYVHPLLMAALPILVLYVQNREETELPIVLLLLGMATGMTVALVALARLLVGNFLRATLFVSIFNLLFFTYGRVFDFAIGLTFLGISQSVWNKILLLASLGILVAAFTWLRTARRDLTPLARFLSGTLCMLVLFSIVQCLPIFAGKSAAAMGKRVIEESQPELHAKYQPIPRITTDSPDKPDIYYIILDAHVRHDVLKNVYGRDNSPFLEKLQSRGFYIANESCSNYPYTIMSVSSSLNMQYLDDVLPPKEKNPNRMVFRALAHRPLIGRVLQSKGYQYILMASNMNMTEHSDYADRVIHYFPQLLQREFSQVLMQTTPLRLLQPSVAYIHLNTFHELTKIPEIPGPKFTLAHIICPHRPFVFGCDGCVLAYEPQGGERDVKNREAYANQLAFVDRAIADVVDQILAKSKTQPIIIIQGDHGTGTLVNGNNSTKPHDMDLLARERLPILNAYLVPEKMRNKLYPSITPVNSFRLLLNECFGENFEILPDRNYIGWYHDLFKLKDATEIVALGAPTAELVKASDAKARKSKNSSSKLAQKPKKRPNAMAKKPKKKATA